MQIPNIRSTIKDQELNVTYHVMAYRTLTRDELVFSVRHYLSQKKVPKSKPGDEVTIISIIGHNE